MIGGSPILGNHLSKITEKCFSKRIISATLSRVLARALRSRLVVPEYIVEKLEGRIWEEVPWQQGLLTPVGWCCYEGPPGIVMSPKWDASATNHGRISTKCLKLLSETISWASFPPWTQMYNSRHNCQFLYSKSFQKYIVYWQLVTYWESFI